MKYVKRLDGTVEQVPGNYQLVDGEQFCAADGSQLAQQAPTTPAVPQQPTVRQYTQDEVNQLLNSARSEERTRLHGTIERERTDHTATRTRLTALEQQARDRELAAMEPQQRLEEQLRQQRAELEATNQRLEAIQTDAAARIRATELVAYAERVIRAYNGSLYTEMVRGNNEAEIDAAAAESGRLWAQHRAEARAEVAREQSMHPQHQQSPHVPSVVIPHNPAYVQPPAPGVVGAYPTPVSPVQQMQTTELSADVTTEDAVRNGTWSGEVRERVMAQLRSGGRATGQVNLGSMPRHLQHAQQQQVVHLPGGVVQPQGHQTHYPQHQAPQHAPVPVPQQPQQQYAPPPQPQQYAPPQPQQYAPPQPQQHVQPALPQPMPSSDPVQLAREAAARTHNGQNPVIGQNPGATGAANLAQQHAQRTGQTPQSAFEARFTPS